MIERVKSELTGAMRAGDRSRIDALRLILSALQRAEKSVPTGEFSDSRTPRRCYGASESSGWRPPRATAPPGATTGPPQSCRTCR